MPEQHLDLDGLADLLAADELADDAHARSCPQCSARLAELRSALEPVAASLAALPLPAAPADLDRRFTTAIDRLRAKPAAATVTPRRARPSRRLAWLPIAGGLAAAAALVVAIVLTNGGSGPSSAGTADGRQAQVTRTSSTGLAYGKDGHLLAAELPALLRGGATGRPTPGSQELSQSDKSASVPAPLAAGAAGAADPLSRLRSTAGLASCLASLTEGTTTQLPLALDYASFDTKPALVVVLPSVKQQKVDVYVVGAGCAQADAQLLYFARLPAP